MLAAILSQTGAATDVLHIDSKHPIPEIKHVDEIRIKLKAAYFDEWDIRMREGEFPELLSTPCIPGWCGAGIIDSIGSEVNGLHVGDEVVVLAPLDTTQGTAAEYTVQPAVNVFLKPARLSFETAAAVLWSGITAFSVLFYSLRTRPGDRILLLTSAHNNDLILSAIAALFGAKLIVATHSKQARELYKNDAGPHISRVVDLTDKEVSVFDAVMEETGGLGVEAVIDLQRHPDPFPVYLTQESLEKLKVPNLDSITHATSPTAEADDVMNKVTSMLKQSQLNIPAAQSSNSLSSAPQDLVNALDVLSPSTTANTTTKIDTDNTNPEFSHLPLDDSVRSKDKHGSSLVPQNPCVQHAEIVNCLAVHGKWITTTPNLQLDPPVSRQLYLRGASVSFLFAHSWLLGATQRGKFAHVVSEVLSLAASGSIVPLISHRVPLDRISQAHALVKRGAAPIGKIILLPPDALSIHSNQQSNGLNNLQQQQHHNASNKGLNKVSATTSSSTINSSLSSDSYSFSPSTSYVSSASVDTSPAYSRATDHHEKSNNEASAVDDGDDDDDLAEPDYASTTSTSLSQHSAYSHEFDSESVSHAHQSAGALDDELM